MEPINGSVSVEISPSSSSSGKGSQIEEAFDLLELCWFFDNLFDTRRKSNMSTSHSDPCLSKVAHQVFDESPAKKTACSSTLNVSSSSSSQNGVPKRRNLLRTPSLPSRIDREDGFREKEDGFKRLQENGLIEKPVKPPLVERKEGIQVKEIRRGKQKSKPPNANLLRTPSLPPCLGREREFGEKETVVKIRNSTQPNLSEFFLTRQEIQRKNASVPNSRCRNPMISDEMWCRFLIQMRKRRSPSELESEEVQGFKDLGFAFDKNDINPTVVDIIPGLREKKEEEEEEEDELENERRVRKPYLSEAWMMLHNHSHLPPIPKWDSRKSAEDMKEQIKFWARAVASNVH